MIDIIFYVLDLKTYTNIQHQQQTKINDFKNVPKNVMSTTASV